MPVVTMIYGLALIALGVIGYTSTGGVSKTALIPAAFGVLVVVAGWLARREHLLKHAMHGAAMLGLIGFLATAKGLLTLITGGAASPAVVSKGTMAVLSLIFLVLCIRSFIQARRAREGA